MEERDYEDFIEFTTGLEEEELPELNKMETDWDIYITYIDDVKALVLVDLAVRKAAPVLQYSNLFGIQIGILNPTEDGFYTEEERQRLFDIEDRIAEVYESEAHAKHVATITTDGSRMMYFYAPDDTYLAGLVGKMASEFDDYDFNYLLEKDAPWNFYFNVLYPDLVDLQLIKNRKTIQNLSAAGIDLSKEHEINHWFFFDNGASRSQAKVRLAAKGYEILEDNFYDEMVPGTPFGLHILAKHNLELETLTEKTYEFFEFIEGFGGIYDGWDLLPDGDPDTDFI